MQEFSSTVQAVKQWESFCQTLVEIGLADNYKEPVDGKGTSASGYDLEKAYQVFVRPHGLSEGGRVNVRFWYDERKTESGFRVNEASVKFSPKGLQTILESMKVSAVLAKHNINLIGKDGKIDLKALAEAAKLIDNDIKAIEKVADGKYVVKTEDK